MLSKQTAAARIGNEAGIYLPVLAVLGTSLIGVIFLLSFNTMILRRASSSFRDVAEDVCSGVLLTAKHVPVTNVVASFADKIDVFFDEANLPGFLGGGRFELNTARLTLPLMREGVDFSYNGTGSTGLLFTTEQSIPTDFGFNCVETTDSCLFRGQVFDTSPKPFPAYVMHENASAYNTVGCEFEGKITVFNLFGVFDGLTGDVEDDQVVLRAQYAYDRPVDGIFDSFRPADSTQNLTDVPGLTVAIATHMQTDPSSVAFKITGSPATAFSPINGIADAASSTHHRDTLAGTITEAVIPAKTHFTTNLIEWSMLSEATYFSGSYDYSEAYEMAVACANPLTKIRNHFLATLLQLASRTGYLRASTEVLHISTEHRWFQYVTSSGVKPTWQADANAAPQYLNAPVQLVQFGRDLLRPHASYEYQLPYIFFDTGGGPDWSALVDGATADDAYRSANSIGVGTPQQGTHPNAPSFGFTFFGRTNPWVDDLKPGRSSPDWRSFHSQLVNQLRVCATFYQNSGTAADPSIHAPQASFFDSTFEPEEMTDVAGGSHVFGATPTQPDQLCPFGAFSEPSCSGSSSYRHQRPTGYSGVDAVSLVGMLGTTQACPVRSRVLSASSSKMLDSDYDGTADSACIKPVDGSNVPDDLRPDFLGLMSYLNSDIEAVKSPGLFPIVNDNTITSGAYIPFNQTTHYVDTNAANADGTPQNLNTPVVIVTHVAPRSAVTTALNNFFTTNATVWNKRKIIVVFMPYNDNELSLAGNLRTAFRTRYNKALDDGTNCESGSACNDDRNFKNVLMILDPTNPDGKSNADYCDGDACSPAELSTFWNQYLDGNLTLHSDFSGMTPESLAEKVFFHEILAYPRRRY